MKFLTRFSKRYMSEKREPLRTVFHSTIMLNSSSGQATVDGVLQVANPGAWMFYLPASEEKYFHGNNGRIDCVRKSRPTEDALLNVQGKVGRYEMDDWRRALSTTVYRRLSEIWLVSCRLWRAGLGPQPLGICFVDQYVRDRKSLGPSCGLISENVYHLPRKRNATLSQIKAAGVVPDQILSCFRQQERGYVIDLCSVVGVKPANAEAEVRRLEQILAEAHQARNVPDSLDDLLLGNTDNL